MLRIDDQRVNFSPQFEFPLMDAGMDFDYFEPIYNFKLLGIIMLVVTSRILPNAIIVKLVNNEVMYLLLILINLLKLSVDFEGLLNQQKTDYKRVIPPFFR